MDSSSFDFSLDGVFQVFVDEFSDIMERIAAGPAPDQEVAHDA